MNYIQVNLQTEPVHPYADILTYELGEIGFESFEEKPDGFTAYVPETLFSENQLLEVLKKYSNECVISHEVNHIPAQNWNAVWESSFQPIVINDQCIIRAGFHKAEKNYPFDIVINPQMSFGTGHHETTSMIVADMLTMDLKNKEVLDMGCGTGILAILAEKCGAAKIHAVDNDEWANENTIENVKINKCHRIIVEKGGSEIIVNSAYNCILANINRNILLEQIPVYASVLQKGGDLLLSGFFIADADVLKEAAAQRGLNFVYSRDKNNWMMLHFKKV